MIYSAPLIQNATNQSSYKPTEVPIGLVGNTTLDRPIVAKFNIIVNTLTGKYVKLYALNNDDISNLPPVIPVEALVVGAEYNISLYKYEIYNDAACTIPYNATKYEFLATGYTYKNNRPEIYVPSQGAWDLQMMYNTRYTAQVLTLTNGNACLIPYTNATAIKIYDYKTNILKEVASATGFSSGVLMPNGNVLLVPYTATSIKIFNPYTYEITDRSDLGVVTGYRSGTLMSNGEILLHPYTATSILAYNTTTGAIRTVGATGAYTGFYGGVLLPNGDAMLIPRLATKIYTYNYTTDIVSAKANATGYQGGTLMANGDVLLIPFAAANLATYNYSTNILTVRNAKTSVVGCQATPDGNILINPKTSDMMFSTYNYTSATLTPIVSTATTGSVFGSCLLPDGSVFSASYSGYFACRTKTPSVPPSDYCTIPSNLSTLPTSNYNLYCNKF